MLTSLFFLAAFILGSVEYLRYVKEYLHFRKVGTPTKAIVVASFSGTSMLLPLKGFPIVEIQNGEKKQRFKTFQNNFSPLTTFAFHNKELNVLIDQTNQDYCMIDWKAPLIIGILFLTGFLTAFIVLVQL